MVLRSYFSYSFSFTLQEQRKLEAENSSLKSQIRDLKDEIEELKLNAEQLQDYRNKVA